MNRQQRPIPILGAFRDFNVTPVAWHMPLPGTEGPYVAILRNTFPDELQEFTMGFGGLRVKLQCFEGEPVQRVVERCALARCRLYAQWVQDSREQALETDELETVRNKMAELIGEEWKCPSP
jgi:hypothetical protein